jgi:hypothetical protein
MWTKPLSETMSSLDGQYGSSAATLLQAAMVIL